MKKIKVLQFICPTGLYGAEMWILALAKYLDRDRNDCHLAVTEESEKQNLEIRDRFQKLGLPAHTLRMSGRFDPRVVINLYRLIKRYNIELIHTHGYKSDILGLIAARLAGIKAIATPHGFENSPDRKLQFFIKLGCLALRHFDRIAPLSVELQADLERMKVPRNRIQIVLNGVDLDEVERVKKEKDTTEKKSFQGKTIGYVGQLAFRKNIPDLLKTFDLFWSAYPDSRLILVGEGPKRTELEEMTGSMASGPQIEFLGYRKDRLQWLKNMDLFSMTSSLEGIPRCMMEAMAMGIPVAAFDIPGVDKLIIPEETGLMAPFGQVEVLKECWERLLYDNPFSTRIAENGRRHVVENFSGQRMAEEYTKLYEEMVKE